MTPQNKKLHLSRCLEVDLSKALRHYQCSAMAGVRVSGSGRVPLFTYFLLLHVCFACVKMTPVTIWHFKEIKVEDAGRVMARTCGCCYETLQNIPVSSDCGFVLRPAESHSLTHRLSEG